MSGGWGLGAGGEERSSREDLGCLAIFVCGRHARAPLSTPTVPIAILSLAVLCACVVMSVVRKP